MIKGYGANVSPCSTPAAMLKWSVLPSGERTFTLVFLQSIIMAATVSSGRPHAKGICSIFPLWMESKALVNSTNIIVHCKLFARTPSRIQQIDKICEVVDIFFRKPFWFFLRMLSILGYMRLPSHHHHHHHHVVPLARISLTLSRHFSLSFIASDRSSGLHHVFSHSCCMYVRAGHPVYIYECVFVCVCVCVFVCVCVCVRIKAYFVV